MCTICYLSKTVINTNAHQNRKMHINATCKNVKSGVFKCQLLAFRFQHLGEVFKCPLYMKPYWLTIVDPLDSISQALHEFLLINKPSAHIFVVWDSK